MIRATDALVDFISSQASIEDLAKELKLHKQTIYNVRNKQSVSSEAIACFLNKTGFSFEKAFEVAEE